MGSIDEAIRGVAIFRALPAEDRSRWHKEGTVRTDKEGFVLVDRPAVEMAPVSADAIAVDVVDYVGLYLFVLGVDAEVRR